MLNSTVSLSVSLLLLLIAAPFSSRAQSRSFQQGEAGYLGVQDAYIVRTSPLTITQSQTVVQVRDGFQGLLRFDNLFGSSAGQIPPGAVILSADLRLTISSGSSDSISLHRVLVPWSAATASWNFFEDGISVADGEAHATPDAIFIPSGGGGTPLNLDVRAGMQAWADGAPNYGWVFMSEGSDVFRFHSSETSTVAFRPRLTVEFLRDGPVSIFEQPQAQQIVMGEPAVFRVEADGDRPLLYQWYFESGELADQTNAFLLLPEVRAEMAGVYSVRVSNVLGSETSDGAVLTVLPQTPVSIATGPQDQTITEGSPLVLEVAVTGTNPSYQWLHNGNLLPGATNASYSKENVSLADYGSYEVIVSNWTSSATASALITVLGTPLDIVPLDHVWKYSQEGASPGEGWHLPEFDDSGWPSGPGVLAVENNALVTPLIRTTLSLDSPSGKIVTYYFRTTFTLTHDPADLSLVTSNLIDDGAVFYLNGVEFHRYLMFPGPVQYSTLAMMPAPEGVFHTAEVPSRLAVAGVNVLAVEVHQASYDSSDVVFGMTLTATPIASARIEFLNHPSGGFYWEGDGPVTLAAKVRAPPGYAAQWLRDGVPVPGATTNALTFPALSLSDRGTYSLQVSNEWEVLESQAAYLEVAPPLEQMLTLVRFTNQWRYQDQGRSMGMLWYRTDVDDSNWPSSAGVFANTTRSLPEPIHTILPLMVSNVAIRIYYFRTRFEFPDSSSPVNLVIRTLLDDGGVYYINGNEIGRIRLPNTLLYHFTSGFSAPGHGTVYETITFTNATLVPGENQFAVGVHQEAPNVDAVFGAELLAFPMRPEAVRIIEQPRSLSVASGFPATMAPEVFGSPPLSFQWFKDGAALPAATSRVLTVSSMARKDSGTYTVVVSNALAAVESEPAFLDYEEDIEPLVALVRGPYLQMGTPTNLLVRWRTDAPAPSVVRYGTDAADLNLTAAGTAAAIDHEVKLEDLSPNTRYYYSIGTVQSTLAGGDDFYFTTAPVEPKPVRIWVLGDSGTASAQARAVADAYKNFPGSEETDVWLMLGDNAYFSGTDNEYQRAMFEMYPDLLRNKVLWSTIGNHETYGPSVEGRFAYHDIFSLPAQGEAGGIPSGTENYYSFDYGNVHFVCLDSEISDRSPNGAMLTWLREDLAANTNQWVIAFWHTPPYSKGSHNSDSLTDSAGRLVQMRENAVPILEEYGVDLVLCGHSHSYERSFLLDGHYGFSDSLAPRMIKDAGSGRPEETGAYIKASEFPAGREGAVYVVAGSSGWATFGSMNHPAMFISLLRMGSVVIDVHAHRLDAKFLRETGAVDDHFTILKGVPSEELRITTVRVAQDEVRLSWKSLAGEDYQVQSSPQIDPAQWTPASELIRATGATTFWTNNLPEFPEMFYRVVQVPTEQP
jgi:hypothetical protein